MNVPKINKTLLYDDFKFIFFNRKINRSNVDKLKKEYKVQDNFKYFPIVVDKHFNIIDGQHRFVACKELKIPVYYIQKNTIVDARSIRTVNKAGKRHNLIDVFEMDYSTGNLEAMKIKRFYEKYDQKIRLNVMISICLDYANGGILKDVVERGNYICIKDSLIDQTCELFLGITENKAVNITLYNAVRYVSKKAEISLVELLKDLSSKKLTLTSNNSKTNIINKVVDTYNYRKTNKVKI